MKTLWFVVPAHGRLELTAICLRQLRRTCDALAEHGIDASAVVVADDENLDTARGLGFGWVQRDNRFLSRKFNDGIQKACDPRFNPRPVDYVVPCGSDDWVHHSLFLELPPTDTIVGFKRMCFVREDGLEISQSLVDYPGGCGIRIYPRQIMERVGYRPADEDRRSGCDTSTLVNLRHAWGETVHLSHPYTDPRMIVDWKSPGQQINSYDEVSRYRRNPETEPGAILAGLYPQEALDEMEAHYASRLVTV